MNHDLICSWLGLPSGEWPPDHYRLLGLEPREGDPRLIEQRVHERLDMVRCYQMMHPEQATEAMNRLAQAFVCLTEPLAKRHYDLNVLGLPVPPDPPVAIAVAERPSPHATPAPAANTKVIVVAESDTVVPAPPVRRPPPPT